MSRVTEGEYDAAMSEALATELGATAMKDIEGIEVAWASAVAKPQAIARLAPAYARKFGDAPAAVGVYKHTQGRVAVSMGPKP